MSPRTIPQEWSRQSRATWFLRLLTVLVFALAAACYVVVSWRWRMSIDTPVMHYVVFLMRHGLKPYSDITDNNMPGAYMVEAAAMSVFGMSDLAWRMYEFFLLGVLVAGAVVIARHWDWVGGVFGAGIFLVLHSAEGPQAAAERDLVIAILLVVGCAFLFGSVRRRSPLLMVGFGLACGLAASIKPLCLPLFAILLVMQALALRRRNVASLHYVLWGIVGLGLAALSDLVFLVHFDALAGFRFVLTRVLPAYAGFSRVPLTVLLKDSLPRVLFVLVLLTAPLAIMNRRRLGRWNWERWVLAICAAFGLFSYLLQGKGFIYHRYIFMIFLLLLIGLEVFEGLRLPGWPRLLAAAIIALTLLVVVPRHLRDASRVRGRSELELTLERDFESLGGQATLQDKVQCFDMVYGCLNALYHQKLVENSGFTGDMLLFQGKSTGASRYYQQRFWTLAAQDPAEVLVVSNGMLSLPNSYARLDLWPAFERYLAANYIEVVERQFAHEKFGVSYEHPLLPEEQDGYRIYILKGSPLLKRGAMLPDAPAVAAAKAQTR